MGEPGFKPVRRVYGEGLRPIRQELIPAHARPDKFADICIKHNVITAQIPERYAEGIHSPPLGKSAGMVRLPRDFHFKANKRFYKVIHEYIIGQKYDIKIHGEIEGGRVALVNGSQYKKSSHGDIQGENTGNPFVAIKHDPKTHGGVDKNERVWLVGGGEWKESEHGEIKTYDSSKMDKAYFTGEGEKRKPVFARKIVEIGGEPHVVIPLDFRKVVTLPYEKYDVTKHGSSVNGKVSMEGVEKNVVDGNIMDAYVLEKDMPEYDLIAETISPPSSILPHNIREIITEYNRHQDPKNINPYFSSKVMSEKYGGEMDWNKFGNGVLAHSEMPEQMNSRLDHMENPKILAHYVLAQSRYVGTRGQIVLDPMGE